MVNYEEFLASKQIVAHPAGVAVQPDEIHEGLYDFQADIVRWALKLGRAAVFAGTGTGKTFIQCEWAHHIVGKVLIVAPLCVASQTIVLAKAKLGIDIKKVSDGAQIDKDGIYITNYEKLKHFVGASLDGIALDESSILKSIDGATRTLLLERFTDIPYRLACTATPAPNDIAEMANHAEFLGHMKRVEMLAAFFVHDDEGWRLRGHAAKPFYRWLASWAMMFVSPADLGYDGSAFVLPPLEIHDEIVKTNWRRPGELFAGGLKGITDRTKIRQDTVAERAYQAAEIARKAEGQVIVWCGLNKESKAVVGHFKGELMAVEMEGSQDEQLKQFNLESFLRGQKKILVSKPKIGGWGLNLQCADTIIFVGLSDSWEAYYQCIRRSWRYGQDKPVKVHIVVTDHEQAIVANVRAKEKVANETTQEVVTAMREYEVENLGARRRASAEAMDITSYHGADWRIVQGDCIDAMREMPDNSVDLSVYSPPFVALYTYSASERDLGNCIDLDKFMAHYRYVVESVKRITKPGRLTAVHCQQVATTQVNDGVIGLRDFRGKLVEEYVKAGWIYHGEICIDKDPQAQAIRTHAKALLFVQLHKDSSWLRPALADYILLFRKPGENAVQIKPDLTHNEWIEWARPIWYGIKETETLNVREGRSEEDDRHICPLQLGVIERCVRLWSNPGETVFDPFMGIGSVGYVALQQGRKAVGAELKPLYAKTAVKNLNRALLERKQVGLFDGHGTVTVETSVAEEEARQALANENLVRDEREDRDLCD